jgi:beta-phosphoglucomutase
MLKAVIFDLDGVIADSHPVHYAAWKALLTEQGRAVTADEMDFIFAGRPRREILRHYFGELSEDRMNALGSRKDELYRDNVHLLKPMPGIAGLLDDLEKLGIAKAVATSATSERTWETLKNFGMAAKFSVVLTGGDAKPKPEPDIFLLAAAKLKVSPDEALVIEDSVAGVAAAKAAGMRCIGYTSKERSPILMEAGADRVISSFTSGLALQFQKMFSKHMTPLVSST